MMFRERNAVYCAIAVKQIRSSNQEKGLEKQQKATVACPAMVADPPLVKRDRRDISRWLGNGSAGMALTKSTRVFVFVDDKVKKVHFHETKSEIVFVFVGR